MYRIFVVEDDEAISRLLCMNLSIAGHEPVPAMDGQEALMMIQSGQRFDVALLDVMLPGVDGFQLMEPLKARGIPVIYLTAKNDLESKLTGLTSGAEDYIVKPFSGAEVMARVRAVMRRLERTAESAQHALSCGSLTLYPDEIRAAVNGETVALTRKEFDLLCLFAENKGRAFSRDHLLDRLWGWDYEGDTRTVDTHIKRLRAKLAKFPHDDWDIKTVWGVGYALEATS